MNIPDPIQGLDVCPISPLGFTECSTDNYQITGNVLVAQIYDFTAAITEPYWALGFSSLGNAYPNSVVVEQAFYFDNTQVYPSDLPLISATKVQFSDEYQTPSGLVQTTWTVTINHASKTITIGDLMTKLPQESAFRACTEILLAFYKMNAFNYPVAPTMIALPYV